MIVALKKGPIVAALPYKCSDLEGDFSSINEMHSGRYWIKRSPKLTNRNTFWSLPGHELKDRRGLDQNLGQNDMTGSLPFTKGPNKNKFDVDAEPTGSFLPFWIVCLMSPLTLFWNRGVHFLGLLLHIKRVVRDNSMD